MSMLVAVMVLAHQANEQLRLQLTELGSHDRARVFLHLDQKASAPPEWLAEMAEARQLCLVPRRSIRWGGFSIIEATRELLGAALAEPDVGTFVLASGSCFPTHGIAGLVERAPILAAQTPFALWEKFFDFDTGERRDDRGAVFKRHDLDNGFLSPGEGKLKRLGWKVADAINRALPYWRRPPISVYKGSQWFCVDRDLAGHLYQCRDYDDFFRKTFAPDELLFQSLFVERLKSQQLPAPPLVDQRAGAQGSHFIAFRPSPVRTIKDRLVRKVDIRAMLEADIDPALQSGCIMARKCSLQICSMLLARAREK